MIVIVSTTNGIGLIEEARMARRDSQTAQESRSEPSGYIATSAPQNARQRGS